MKSMEPSESEIQKSILDYLQIKGYFCFRNNTGAFHATHNGKDRFHRYGFVGSGDIFGMTKQGIFFSIEVKRPGKKPTPAQIDFIKAVNDNHGLSFVATCIEDVIRQGL